MIDDNNQVALLINWNFRKEEYFLGRKYCLCGIGYHPHSVHLASRVHRNVIGLKSEGVITR